MKKRFLVYTAVLILMIAFNAFGQTEANYEGIGADYEKLKAEFESLRRDRDNLNIQLKALVKYKNEIVEIRKDKEAIELERKQWQLEKQTLENQNKNLLYQKDLLIDKIGTLEAQQFKLEQERDEINKLLSKAKAGHIIIDDLRKQIKDKEKEVVVSEKKAELLDAKAKSAENKLAEEEAKSEILREQIKEIKSKYKDALAQNKTLEKKIEQQPKEYAEIARENKILLKRTALMHYNLGVFYTKNKEYNRAVSEFEKAIEINPEDAQAYFNLGYIYAEYFVDRPKAIDNFQKYLQLAKKEDEDIEWVKKYILTWQTWEGKKPAK
ncbi:MAG: tetratricopeptide repeat protein [Candidatus Omnitrophica bacterium]|nr:tetratricopeptide repeat protein [Candidatus Omnitrophota bacterium]